MVGRPVLERGDLVAPFGEGEEESEEERADEEPSG